MHCVIAHRRRYDNVPLLATFPVRDVKFLQIENRFSHTPLDVLISILDYSLKEHSGYVQTLLFLRDTFRLDDFVGMAKNNRIRPGASDGSFELTLPVIFHFLSFFRSSLLLCFFAVREPLKLPTGTK
jgi:hypothetical protein